MNNIICFINKGSFTNNNPKELIYLDNYDNKREINSVNIRKKHLEENINKKKSTNILTPLNNRISSSENKIKGNNSRQVFSPCGNIRKINNKKMNYIKKKQHQGQDMKNLKKLNNNKIIVTNKNLRISNSYNNINRNNNNNMKQNINNFFRIKNNNSLDYNLNMRKDINKDINIKNKNQNNLKRIFLTNNNNFIRLDKMKNNLNGEYFYKNQNMTVPSNKIDKDISPNYNTYKNNYLESLPNYINNYLLPKRIFPSFKYKTENDSNSALIHNNNYYNHNNLINANNRVINNNNFNKINSNKSNDNMNKNNNNFSNRKINENNPLFIEIHSEIIKNSNKNNLPIKRNEFFSETEFVKKNNGPYQNYLNNKYKTEDKEINYFDGSNKNMNRINKYKMIRYKEN